jgi:hypothetical protein
MKKNIEAIREIKQKEIDGNKIILKDGIKKGIIRTACSEQVKAD